MKRIFCVIMALVTLIGSAGIFAGCGGKEKEEVARIPIVENGKSNYVIIYPDTPTAAEIEAATKIKSKIHEITGVLLKSINEEFMDEEPNAHYIYVGDTTFEPAKATKEQISKEYFDSYAIDVADLDVYFVGASKTALNNAVTYFVDNLVEKNYDAETKTLYFEACRFDGTVTMPTDFSTKNIKEYAIIYPDSEEMSMEDIAVELQSVIKSRTGFSPDIYKDTEMSERKFEILVGETNRALSKRCYEKSSRVMECEFVVEQCKIQLAFGGYYSGKKCIEEFSYKVLRNQRASLPSGNHNKISFAEREQALTSGADIRIMSANILSYRWGEKVDPSILPVSYRCEIFAGALLKFRPDAVGIQETDEPWLDALPWYLDRMAKKDGVEYTHLFDKLTHANKTMVNFSSIVYRSDMYKLDDSGYKVFSIWDETPNYFQRVATYVKLASKTDTQKQFILVNTHWAHENAEMVDACATEQAELVNKLKSQYDGVSIFCTGDYNNLSTRVWKDTYLNKFVSNIDGKIASKVAKENGVLIVPGGCRGDASKTNENVLRAIDDSFIDHIICTGGAWEIKCHDTIRENKCGILTDHSLIYADIDLK